MTDNEFKQWLRSPSSIKCVLVEASYNDGTEKVMYLSNFGYVTSGTDSPANVSYKPAIKGGLDISASIGGSGESSISWGDIEIDNTEKRHDAWLNYIWKNKNISVYLGDPTWIRSEFRLIFSGKIEDLLSQDRVSLNLVIRDKLNALNTSMTEAVLGGTTSNKNAVLPLCFGECHNIEPLLIDPVALRYQVHNGIIERIIEVRDNGVPVPYTANLTNGTFVLSNSPIGTITCSVQGAKFGGVYYNDIGNLVKNIVKTYGKSPVTDSDIDLSNFSTFITNHPQPVGIYLSDKANVLEVISELTKSVNATLIATPLGLLQLQKIDLPSLTFSHEIYPFDMKEMTFQISNKEDVSAAVTLNYCKNYTVQENLQTGLPPEHLSMFAKEWFEAKDSDLSISSAYTLTTEVQKEDTLLLVTTDAQAESTRRLNLRKVQRYVYSFESDLSLLLVGLGNYVKITQSRYGFESGRIGQVMSISINWFDNSMSFGVLV